SISPELEELSRESTSHEIPVEYFTRMSNSIRRQVGQRIREAREDAGLSQQGLADKLEKRQAYISELETGKTEPDVNTLIQLSYYLGRPVEFFIPPAFRDFAEP